MWDNRLNREYSGDENSHGAFMERKRNPRTTVGWMLLKRSVEMRQCLRLRSGQSAKEAADVIRRSGYQSPANLAEMAKSGGFSGNVPAAQDFQRAIEIYEKPLSYFKGKMHAHKEPTVNAEYSPPVRRENQTAYVDMANFDGLSVMVALVEPLNMSVCVALKNHQAPELIRAVKEISAGFATWNLKVATVECIDGRHDPERGIAA